MVLNLEVLAIKNACEALDPDYKPCLTFIVVQKRHHVRFFPSKEDGDDKGNSYPGTVIDRVITDQRDFDFYL